MCAAQRTALSAILCALDVLFLLFVVVVMRQGLYYDDEIRSLPDLELAQ